MYSMDFFVGKDDIEEFSSEGKGGYVGVVAFASSEVVMGVGKIELLLVRSSQVNPTKPIYQMSLVVSHVYLK